MGNQSAKMEYRKLDKLGIETSLLGFGCMRFPTDASGKIDEEKSQKMLDEAMAGGVNYYDTAWPYHGGQSEVFVGKALKKYPRESFYLATKLPCWDVKCVEDAERIFNKQLERLQTDYVDFYLLHALNKGSFQSMVDAGVLPFLDKLKEEGKIKYIGFSFHDSYEAFEYIAKYREWDFCQIQYNYMDRNEQAGDKGYALTEELGLPLIIMEPIKGGALCKLPDEIMDIVRPYRKDASAASWALSWVGSHPNVKVILSGMSAMEHVEDNLNTFCDFNNLSEEEMKAMDDVAEALRKRVKNGCTGCRYCMPCPAGVNIPKNFEIWNTYNVYGDKGKLAWQWKHDIPDEAKADKCIKCGKCEAACPQKISIREDLVRVAEEIKAILGQ